MSTRSARSQKIAPALKILAVGFVVGVFAVSVVSALFGVQQVNQHLGIIVLIVAVGFGVILYLQL